MYNQQSYSSVNTHRDVYICSLKDTNEDVHHNSTYNSQKLEINKISINTKID